jgi:hypothetical protein
LLGALGAAIAGGVGTGIGWLEDPKRTAFSYLFAFAVGFTVVIGALFLLMIGHASDARWFVAIRRLAEHIVAALPLLAVLFVPVLLSMHELYPWTRLASLSDADREVVETKTAWLNTPFFIVRAVLYFTVFIVVAELLRSWSLRQDREPAAAEPLRRRMIALGAGGLPLLSVTVTLASFDWLMSLEPTWFSNIYGVYIFAGGFVAALGLFGMQLVLAERNRELPPGVSVEHFSVVGRFQLGMIIFWTYIGWAQLVLLWIADLPLEVTWYVARWHGGWEWVGILLLVLHWGVPFFFLLQRGLKRRADTFFAMSAWIVLVHVVDIFYLVIPAVSPGRFEVRVTDVAALVAIAGALVAFCMMRARGARAYPVSDPTLDESIRYEAAL